MIHRGLFAIGFFVRPLFLAADTRRHTQTVIYFPSIDSHLLMLRRKRTIEGKQQSLCDKISIACPY